jgi:hypothetical protein
LHAYFNCKCLLGVYIEITLRKQIQEEIAPEIAQFFFREVSQIETGRLRKIKTILGEVSITENQAQYFGLKSHSRLSPKMTKNALLVCANESYKRAEEDLKELTGINISHSTLQRLVNQQELELPESKLGVQEAMVDGGKVRLRTEERGKPCEWRDYKAVSLNAIPVNEILKPPVEEEFLNLFSIFLHLSIQVLL